MDRIVYKINYFIVLITLGALLLSCSETAAKSVNSNMAFYSDGNKLYFDLYNAEKAQNTHSLVLFTDGEVKTNIDNGWLFPSIYSDGISLYYAKYNDSNEEQRIDIIRSDVDNLENKETLFTLDYTMPNVQMEYIYSYNGHVYYFSSDGALWDYYDGKAEVRIEKALCSMFYNDSIYYVDSDNILCVDNLSFTDRREITSKYKIFDDEICSEVLKAYGEDYGEFISIYVSDDYVYMVLSDAYDGYIFKCKTDGSGLSHVGVTDKQKVKAENIQLIENKLYAAGKLIEGGNIKKGLIEINLKTDKIELIEENILGFSVTGEEIYYSKYINNEIKFYCFDSKNRAVKEIYSNKA